MAQMLLGDTLLHNAYRKPTNAVALSYPDGELTWRELDARANQRARYFKSLGIGIGDFVVMGLPNTLAFHETTFALWKLGATPTIVSAKLPRHEFDAIVALAQPKLVIANGISDAGVPCISSGIDVSTFDGSPLESALGPYWKAMTSGGSTGRPKIIVDHMPTAWDSEVSRNNVMMLEHDSVILNPGPLYHNAPFLFSHLALFGGSKVVGQARFDAEEALKLIEAHRVNWVNLVPTMMHRIWSLPEAVRQRYDLSSLKTVWHMAAPCPDWLKEVWINWLGGDRIWELYGGTEALGSTIINGDEWIAKRGSVGRIMGESKIKAVREDGTTCDPGEIGELYILPPVPDTPPSHYLGAEARERAGGWRTLGDLGSIDEDGYVFLADRRTDLILRGGANIYPAEIEAVLDAHPGIGSSIVVGLPDDELGQRVHAIVQSINRGGLDIADVHRFASEKLTKYKLPESYEVTSEPLRDDAGKARRSALRDERAAWTKEGRAFRTRP